jgi:SAM-dependent MidA family methyltransferase
VDRSSSQRQVEGIQQVILSELRKTPKKQLPFAQVMEIALYHSNYGYYSKPTPKLGKAGDFFTNVHVSDLFGRVVADYFLQYWQQKNASSALSLVEIGGGDGRLLQHITTQFQLKGVAKSAIHIYSVERSPYHQKEQQKRLSNMPYAIHWVDKLADVPKSPFSIVYSHELVDAFPVHRLIWKDGMWWEIYVTEKENKLVEIHDSLSTVELQKYVNERTEEIVEGQQIEGNLHAKKWMKEVADWIQSGLIWTLDYGTTTRDLHSVRYLDGTMRYYQSHQHVDDPYPLLGDIDMTAHVNFADLMLWGEQSALTTCFYGSQSTFLVDAGIFSYTDPGYRNAMKQLVMGMGESFHVLVQSK